MFTKINLNTQHFTTYSVDGEKVLSNLSKINIFIGPNNSGKSSFLRSIFSNQEIQFGLNTINLDQIFSQLQILNTEIENLKATNGITNIQGVQESDFLPFNFFSFLEIDRLKILFDKSCRHF